MVCPAEGMVGTGRRAEVRPKESRGTYVFHNETSPTHRFAINGAPTHPGSHALPSFGDDLVGGEIQLLDQDGVHVLMGEDRYSELATRGKV